MTDVNTQAPDKASIPEHELVAADYRIYPLTEALVIGVVVFLAIFLTTYFIYLHALNAQKGEIRDGLVRTCAALATFVDGDAHKQFISQDQEGSAAYNNALEPFKKVLAADPSIAFVYTTILQDNAVKFVLDPTESGDANGDGVDDKSHIMQDYPEASAELVRALHERITVTTEEPYKDRWGSFVSGYVPFYDAENNFVGVLGIDIHAENYFERLAPIKRATVRAIVTGFFISFLIAALVWFMRNFSKIINRRRQVIYHAYTKLKQTD